MNLLFFLSVFALGLHHGVHSAPGGPHVHPDIEAVPQRAYSFPQLGVVNSRQGDGDNDGIHLAVHPQCGPLNGKTTNVNAGIVPASIKTIVAFGVRLFLS